MLAKAITTTGAHALALSYTKTQVALKAIIIIPTIEMKSVASPNTNFKGNDLKKSNFV
jgi:hypothetical protein